MKSVSTLSEIKLYRRHLKTQLHYAEERIENEYLVILAGYRSWIVYTVFEKGTASLLNYIFRKVTGRS
jgi:hypothetical protein